MKYFIQEIKNTSEKINKISIFKGNLFFAEKRFVLKELGNLPNESIGLFIIKGPILLVVSNTKSIPANDLIEMYCQKTNTKGGGTLKIAQAAIKNSDTVFEYLEKLIKEKYTVE